MEHSLPGSSVHGILQTRKLEWFAMPSSEEFSWPSLLRWQACFIPLLPAGTSSKYITSIQSLSYVQRFATSWTAARWASLSIINSQSLLRLMSIALRIPSNRITLCCPLFLLPSIFPIIRDFSNESVLHIRCPKYWNFSFNVSPSNVCSGLISFRIDWFDLLDIQGTLKSLLQHHSSKSSILQSSAFFVVQLPHPYMTTGKKTKSKNHSFD